jgi:hypothetical protein
MPPSSEPSVTEHRSWQVPRKHVDFRGLGGYVVLPPSKSHIAYGSLRG